MQLQTSDTILDKSNILAREPDILSQNAKECSSIRSLDLRRIAANKEANESSHTSATAGTTASYERKQKKEKQTQGEKKKEVLYKRAIK